MGPDVFRPIDTPLCGAERVRKLNERERSGAWKNTMEREREGRGAGAERWAGVTERGVSGERKCRPIPLRSHALWHHFGHLEANWNKSSTTAFYVFYLMYNCTLRLNSILRLSIISHSLVKHCTILIFFGRNILYVEDTLAWRGFRGAGDRSVR